MHNLFFNLLVSGSTITLCDLDLIQLHGALELFTNPARYTFPGWQSVEKMIEYVFQEIHLSSF